MPDMLPPASAQGGSNPTTTEQQPGPMQPSIPSTSAGQGNPFLAEDQRYQAALQALQPQQTQQAPPSGLHQGLAAILPALGAMMSLRNGGIGLGSFMHGWQGQEESQARIADQQAQAAERQAIIEHQRRQDREQVERDHEVATTRLNQIVSAHRKEAAGKIDTIKKQRAAELAKRFSDAQYMSQIGEHQDAKDANRLDGFSIDLPYVPTLQEVLSESWDGSRPSQIRATESVPLRKALTEAAFPVDDKGKFLLPNPNGKMPTEGSEAWFVRQSKKIKQQQKGAEPLTAIEEENAAGEGLAARKRWEISDPTLRGLDIAKKQVELANAQDLQEQGKHPFRDVNEVIEDPLTGDKKTRIWRVFADKAGRPTGERIQIGGPPPEVPDDQAAASPGGPAPSGGRELGPAQSKPGSLPRKPGAVLTVQSGPGGKPQVTAPDGSVHTFATPKDAQKFIKAVQAAQGNAGR